MILRVLTLLWDGIAPALKNHLWQSTFFLLLAALLALALRRNHARARYWLWLAASVKFLVPFSLLVALGSHIHLPHRPAPAQAGIYVAMDEFSQPFTPEFAPVAIAAAAPTTAVPDLAQLLPRVLAAVWFAGFAIVLCVWAVYWRRVSAAVRHAVPIGEGRELATLRRLEAAAGVTRGVGIVEFPGSTQKSARRTWGTQIEVMEPGIFGIARPVLIWPKGMSARLDEAHLEAILAHEVCHVRRRDNLTAAVHMLVEATFWFHPLVWWLGARLVEERERACDEEVLRLCNRPEVYAESILKVCEFCLESPLPCVSGVTGSDLKRRIVNVLAAHVSLRLGLGKKALLAVAGLCVVAAPLLLGQAQAARRMMLAAVAAAPKPVRAWAAAHAMIAEEQTPLTGLIAQAQPVPPFPAIAQEKAADAQNAAPVADAVPAIKFDVVLFKPCQANALTMKITIMPAEGDSIGWECQSIGRMVWFAFTGRQPFHMIGEPAWVDNDAYTFQAKVAPEDVAVWRTLSMAAKRAMMRDVLAEELKLKVHADTTEYPVYALIVAKGGPKLTPRDGKGSTCVVTDTTPCPPKLVPYQDDEETKLGGGKLKGRDITWVGQDTAYAQGTTMAGLAESLTARLDRPVVDKTGMAGFYDVTLTLPFLHYDPKTANAEDTKFSEIFDGVKALGLRLEPDKAPLNGIVVDHIERPSEN